MTRDKFFTAGGGPVKPRAAQERLGAKYATSPKNCSGIRGAGYAATEKLAYSPAAHSQSAQFGGGRNPGRYS